MTRPAADLCLPEYTVLTGDPVDVARGAVLSTHVDARSPAADLVFRRAYSSRRSDRSGSLGWGWAHSFDQTLWLEVGRVVVLEGGRKLEFDCLDCPDQVVRAGDVLRDVTGRVTLACRGRGAWELHDGQTTRQFVPMPGTSLPDANRGLSHLAVIVRPRLPRVELHYDRRARLSSVRVEGKPVFSLRYDVNSRLAALNDRAMRYGFSPEGDLVEAVDGDGHARTYAYQGHLLVSEVDRRGAPVYFGYDGHDAGARCVRTWGEGGRLQRLLEYQGGTTRVTNSLGDRTTYSVSPVGLVTAVEGPLGAPTTLEYDASLRLTTIRFADDTAGRDVYDDAGNVVGHRDRDGAEWTMEYDAHGRLTAGVDPVGGRWIYGYDRRGALCKVQDPLRHVTRFEYEDGRLTKVIDPLGQVTRVSVGSHDELLAVDTPGRSGLRFRYDEIGNLVAAETSSGERGRWSYDAWGRLTGAMRSQRVVRWRRDAEGAVVERHTPEVLETYTRDAFGRLVALSGEPVAGTGGRPFAVRYDYDTEDHCERASCEGGPRIEWVRDLAGRVLRYAVDGELHGELERDPISGAIVAFTDAAGTRATMRWDRAGRLLECKDPRGARSYAYRQDGLLVSFSGPDGSGALQRNALGVVLEQTVGSATVSTPDLDHRGRRYGLETPDGLSISYLRSRAGTLERIAVTSAGFVEIDLAFASDGSRGVARHGSQRMDFAIGRPPDRHFDPEGPCDALFRPRLGGEGGDVPLLWDEDRVLREGDAVHVHLPRSGQHLATVRGDRVVFAGSNLAAGGASGAGGPSRAAVPTAQPGSGTELERALRRCRLGESCADASLFELTPGAWLQRFFSRAVWDPQPRPSPGAAPWSPDAWGPPTGEPDGVGGVRLRNEALMRSLSPFPRPKLTLRDAGL